MNEPFIEPVKENGLRDSLLISAQDLAEGLQREAALPVAKAPAGAPPWVVVDCRFNLQQPDAGWQAYRSEHIPGAWYADLDWDLSAQRGIDTGRHPLPDPEVLRVFFGRLGITPAARVVVYDEAGGGLAARLWWLLRWMGHRQVVLLDGGFAAWQKAGLPLSDAIPDPRNERFTGTFGHMPVINTPEILAALAGNSIRLLDVRAEERFLGRVEPIDTVAGHVPGALNVPFAGNLGPDQQFHSTEHLAQRYGPIVEGRHPGAIVCMCGSGVTACHGVFALELAGVPGVALYPGSWSEWIRSKDRPVATE
ncbi:MAG: sulfurtransferase [Gammaproteobacteria bacterium]|nr:sulfurtransferase [Gammaproteobacteria bacterium]